MYRGGRGKSREEKKEWGGKRERQKDIFFFFLFLFFSFVFPTYLFCKSQDLLCVRQLHPTSFDSKDSSFNLNTTHTTQTHNKNKTNKITHFHYNFAQKKRADVAGFEPHPFLDGAHRANPKNPNQKKVCPLDPSIFYHSLRSREMGRDPALHLKSSTKERFLQAFQKWSAVKGKNIFRPFRKSEGAKVWVEEVFIKLTKRQQQIVNYVISRKFHPCKE